MKRLLSAVLALSITAVCLWFLLTPDVMQALGQVASNARPIPIIVAFGLVALVQWLRAWRFAVMTAGTAALPDTVLVRIALQLNFLNFVLPFRLGELGYPVLMRRHYGHGLLHSAGVLLLARLFDLATVVSILLGAAAVLRLAGGTGNAMLALGSMVLGLAPFGLILAGRALRPWLTRLPGVGVSAAKLTAGLDAVGERRMGGVAVRICHLASARTRRDHGSRCRNDNGAARRCHAGGVGGTRGLRVADQRHRGHRSVASCMGRRNDGGRRALGRCRDQRAGTACRRSDECDRARHGCDDSRSRPQGLCLRGQGSSRWSLTLIAAVMKLAALEDSVKPLGRDPSQLGWRSEQPQ
jgi:hypothetical protein